MCIETPCSHRRAPLPPLHASRESPDQHLYSCAHFQGVQSSGNQVFTYTSQQTYITPYNLVDRGPNGLFVYGGGYGDNPAASGSFVARIEPTTFNEVWRRVLINTNVTNEWNYPGVVSMDRDGNLVVIYGYHIAKLDPATGNVLAQTTLPTGASAPVRYVLQRLRCPARRHDRGEKREPSTWLQGAGLQRIPQLPEPNKCAAVGDRRYRSVHPQCDCAGHAA